VAQAALPAPTHALETNTGLDNRKLLMWLFLGSECLFFGSFIAAYMLYRNRNTQGPYPDELFDIPFTSVSSFVLLMSSLSMVLALAAIQQGDVRRMRIWLLATSVLGMLFLGGQAFEFTEFYREGLRLDTNMFGTTFVVLTGFHGAHVTVGVLILMSMWASSFKGKITQENALNVELAGLYWHFVDIVWIIIFTMIYLVQV
jgi:cytochrome c oxidase subunit 3/cytochrome o ubiquinol oxidase subunit 3